MSVLELVRIPLAQLEIHALALLLGPPELGGQPVPESSGGGEIDWLFGAPWPKAALLVAVAVAVPFFVNSLTRARKTRRGLRPKPDFDLSVAKLDALPCVPLASAAGGPTHVEGVLREGEGALGTGEFACIYHNRHGAGRATAIAVDLALLSDGEGTLLGLEGLEQARVIAPREDGGPHDTISLYLGDRVQVLGDLLVFDAARDISEGALRGMLGSRGQIQIRVLERARPASPESPPTSPAEPEPEPEPDSGPSERAPEAPAQPETPDTDLPDSPNPTELDA
ncbi:hypothetical protein G6O69_11030 [Pseudenhygromyxa sp. WMMC2535]|uniref:hypothetical protein n=1 Tax=Pseudenhygromyxa sp. WMMC2535 TaxID=2712867 RepID=UPI001556DE9E|nr:hypothetical protein [Pseudenhygromyxa sp. WMMC2535]NVB38364.1 hypothetical protein [Pseudenhygromyxa sp. WMMC2535]